MALIVSSWTFIALSVFVACGLSKEAASGKNSRSIFKNGPCSFDQFRCSNNKCISKSQFCDNRNDCGDNSDEQFCRVTKCPADPPRMVCYNNNNNNDKCIPQTWKCDGQKDCLNGKDEVGCVNDENLLSLSKIAKTKREALKWILESRNSNSASYKWGSQVARKAVAWYLGDQDSFVGNKAFMSELAYEINIGFLSRVVLKSLKGISSTELATHVNAFLVTCVDPRHFYGMDLVRELRERADASNETHPSVTLALCNSGEDISQNDIAKTIVAFWTAHRNNRTDVEALAVLALSCAAARDHGLLENVDMFELTLELKKKQFRNGTVESLKTTALVMQALYASEKESDEDNFDEEKALMHILKSQKPDGSFGNPANIYYALPLLSYKSLINLSSSHCAPRITDEKGNLHDFLNLVGLKSRVRFSLWIGNNRTLEKTITLKVPTNTSFYGVMEWAARVDTQYRFEYSMRDRKPYIFSISGIQDDPENNLFWFLHSIDSREEDVRPTLITKSPADVFPKDGQHIVFWYKRG